MQVPDEHTTVVFAPVRILRPPDDANPSHAFFADAIPGVRAVGFGTVELDATGTFERPLALTLAFPTMEPGAIFPAQYHSPGVELACIVRGQGAIEVVDGKGNILDRYPFAAGDIALIGPDVLYQVRNDSPTMPLCAWVCFPSGTDSFWPDGRKA